MVTIVPPPTDAQDDGAHRPECGCLPPYADCPHPPCDCWVCADDGPDALDSLPIAALLHSRLTSWFGDDRQSFLVADLIPVVTQIVAEFQHNALEMARARDRAERRAEALATAADKVGHQAVCPVDPCECWMRDLAPLLDDDSDAAVCPDCAGEWAKPMREGCRRPWHHADEWADDCDHDWLDRPESDTRECLICGVEVAG